MKYFWLIIFSLFLVLPVHAAEFNLSRPESTPNAGTWPVTVSLHNPEASQNRGLVAVELRLTFNKDWKLTKDDIHPEVASPWAFAQQEIKPGQLLIEAIYVKAGTTGDTTVGPEKFVTLNFHPSGPGRADIHIDIAGSLLIAKNNTHVLNQQAPATLDVSTPSVPTAPEPFLVNLWHQLLRIFGAK